MNETLCCQMLLVRYENLDLYLSLTYREHQGLFRERLSERLTWVDLDKLSKQQAELARQYLERRDYVRSALFGWEALVSFVCEKEELDPCKRKNREDLDVPKAIQKRKRKLCRHLNQIRNALAHGTPPSSNDVREMLQDEEKLRSGLQEAFNVLL